MVYQNLINSKGLVITALFGWLVPHIYVRIAQYRIALLKSSDWEGEKLVQGLRAITYHSSFAILAGGIFLSITATGVALSTRELDINMVYMLAGFSRLLSAITLYLLSVQIPTWLGLYHHRQNTVFFPYSTLKALRFNVWWGIWRCFFMVYFLLLPFFCGTPFPAEIPIVMISGIIGGFLICMGVFYGRTKFKERKMSIGLAMIVILCILSSVSFAGGCWYIQYVWDVNAMGQQKEYVVWVCSVISWFVAASITHVALWRWSKKYFQSEAEMFNTEIFDPKTFKDFTTAEDVKGSGIQSQQSEQQINTAEDMQFDNIDETYKEIDEETLGPLEHHTNSETNKIDQNVDTENPVDTTCQNKEVEEDDRFCFLIREKCCCACCCKCCKSTREKRVKSVPENILYVTKWSLWSITSLLATFVTIINIGATAQVRVTMRYLPVTDEILYNYINEGPVCSFRYNGSTGPYTVTTFETADAARNANETIVHCGACGACSTWNNLKIEWTTRKVLGEKAKKCAVKGLFSGSSAAVQCMDETVGFDEACSKCWINDMQCATHYCAFIGIQSMMINTLSNLTVAPGAITSATCEEAMCELEFVPCSGASRRRMNIHSGIERPTNQQCTNVNGSQWEPLFGP